MAPTLEEAMKRLFSPFVRGEVRSTERATLLPWNWRQPSIAASTRGSLRRHSRRQQQQGHEDEQTGRGPQPQAGENGRTGQRQHRDRQQCTKRMIHRVSDSVSGTLAVVRARPGSVRVRWR